MKENYLFTNIETTYNGLVTLRNHRLLKDFSVFSGISYGRVWALSGDDINELYRLSIKNFIHLMKKLEEYFELNSIDVDEVV